MDEPPPLCSLSMLDQDSTDTADGEERSVMDEMLQVATQAKAIKHAAKLAEQKKRTKSFGDGLKKGFFHEAKAKKPAAKATRVPANQDEEDAIPTIRRNPANASLRLPDVQAAMAEMQNLKPDDWMTPAFFEKVAQNPKLCQALKNPRFTAAIQEMATNPTAAIEKYQKDADFGVMFQDFLQFLGHHFEQLAEDEKSLPPPRSMEDIQRHALETMSRTPNEEAQVQRILRDPELQAILGDPAMRDVLETCQSQPGALATYMQDCVFGPKICKLAAAGLVQLHP
ncbi:Aste57867_13157 [Aphanomyces stellatus]|uniref:Aste57867_13157 protein n=1 Tax=Aphanomyces stellatus TaxID=120398 RepID=A0A485KXP1_9STRA|nr:hypothetical protein As57867_013108 [Aphanomyces stellatus]VFT89998.1 Aste57867_13157 [Aphanomyces stellatus]